MRIFHRAKFWEIEKECCGTCSHVFPDDALIKPDLNATCLLNESPIRNARKNICNEYNRRK